MKVHARYTFAAERQQLWDLLLDIDTLQQCIPGLEKLEPQGDGKYPRHAQGRRERREGDLPGQYYDWRRGANRAVPDDRRGTGAPRLGAGAAGC